jgi:microcin C transport system substrate-binding protein
VVGGVKGSLAGGIDLLFDTLMAPALDEVSTEYGLLAEAVSHPDDHSSVTYRLRANAQWHDGRPVSVDDVIFSLAAFKKHHPQFSAYYRHVVKAERTGERDVTFTFDAPGNRELPQIVGQLTVLPKHWWEGTDKSERQRDIGTTTLEPLLGNGAYRIKEFVAGRTIVYERVANYWGRDLNVNVGRDNFNELRFEYFRDTTVATEAFKGDAIDWRVENSAKSWATAYDFPAVKDKRVVLEEFPIRSSGGMQAYAFNIRRRKFADPRVRRAFNFALNFEELNKQIFFDQYFRISSYFQNLELASSGLPEGEELAILETVRDKVPPEVFTTAYSNPVNGSAEAVRNNLREATRLLRSAGYEVRNQKLVNAANGEAMTVEFLIDRPEWERIVLPYKPSLERLGMQVTVRIVDDAQYENRLRQWDYDIIVASWGQSLSPGNEQRGFWGSQAADQPGSRNLIGIKNPAVDALIDRLIFATSRSDLIAASKALDRVLLWNQYVVPQWTYGKLRTARWDRFGHPKELPRYGAAAFPTIWWWDAEKAAKTTRSRS